MPTPSAPAKPAWNQAAMWMGAGLPGLVRILHQAGWRVPPAAWPICLIDLVSAVGNSGLGNAQAALYRASLRRIELHPQPVFVIGHWRTGTTLLHELLALDPRHTFPTTYQCFLPHHFLLSEDWVARWIDFAIPPSRPDAVPLGWEKPQEDEFALCNLGVPSLYASIAFPNQPFRHLEYLELDTIPEPNRRKWCATWQSFLRRVHYRRAGRMILKSPTHSFRIPWLLRMFPEARFVHMVRHPLEVYLSTLRLWESLYTAHGYQTKRQPNLKSAVLDLMVRLSERVQSTRDSVPSGQWSEVRFERLVEDPVATLHRVYEQLDLGSFEPVRPHVEQYVDGKAGYSSHRYQPPAEIAEQVFDRCRADFERYEYPREPA